MIVWRGKVEGWRVVEMEDVMVRGMNEGSPRGGEKERKNVDIERGRRWQVRMRGVKKVSE